MATQNTGWIVVYSDLSNGGPDIEHLTQEQCIELYETSGECSMTVYEYDAPEELHELVGYGLLFCGSWVNDGCRVRFFRV